MKALLACLAVLIVATWCSCGQIAHAAQPSAPPGPAWDTFSDSWGATDALGRSLPGLMEAGPARTNRFVGIFYFLWMGPHVNGGPHDITRILAREPGAMTNSLSPPWGPLHAMHHWGESIFGHYNSDDPWVLRKHAQMLNDAGVDVVIFDVTNGFTYRSNYLALLRVFAQVRSEGGSTPQIAFLCPFGDPRRVVTELWKDLYEPPLYPELWFRWEGKPLILADPALIHGATEGAEEWNMAVSLRPQQTLGQTFKTEKPFTSAGGCFPTWGTTNGALTLTLYRQGQSPRGERIASERFEDVADNAWLSLHFSPALPPGAYYLEASEGRGNVGWWSHTEDVFGHGAALAEGQMAGGDRALRVVNAGGGEEGMRRFFTFRKPQPDYFRGPTQPDMWSWLEVYPQHMFRNSRGETEQMSVGVAQNAVGNRLGSMSEAGSHGRSYHNGASDPRPGAVNLGLNFGEQFEYAIKQDPKFILVTGWNEWIAGRFNEFAGIREPVMFVDEFDQERSRDIEPMRGGHGDNYYYQLVSFIRRYKGVRPAAKAAGPKTIQIDGGFTQWREVTPEYRDDAGDTTVRDYPGYNQHTRYVNRSGRNDFVSLKVARDDRFIYFYARTRDPITPWSDPGWMRLLIDVDCNRQTGWEGYDYVVNRKVGSATSTTLEKNASGWNWQGVRELALVTRGNELHLAVPRNALGLEVAKGPIRFDFKWTDNVPDSGNILDFLADGDVAPNARFNYHFEE